MKSYCGDDSGKYGVTNLTREYLQNLITQETECVVYSKSIILESPPNTPINMIKQYDKSYCIEMDLKEQTMGSFVKDISVKHYDDNINKIIDKDSFFEIQIGGLMVTCGKFKTDTILTDLLLPFPKLVYHSAKLLIYVLDQEFGDIIKNDKKIEIGLKFTKMVLIPKHDDFNTIDHKKHQVHFYEQLIDNSNVFRMACGMGGIAINYCVDDDLTDDMIDDMIVCLKNASDENIENKIKQKYFNKLNVHYFSKILKPHIDEIDINAIKNCRLNNAKLNFYRFNKRESVSMREAIYVRLLMQKNNIHHSIGQ
jgi:hypothetical protein